MSTRRLELAGAGALTVVGVLTWALVRTYPNYDAYYHLAWGRELMAGHAPTFKAYQAPTEHPLYLALCAVLGLAGEQGDRLLVLFTVLCHVAFVVAVYRLGTALWDRRAGAAAALLAGSSFALLLYAARAYVDEPFLAMVLWAGALEAERTAGSARDRTRVIWALLVLAGLLRPEAWLLAGGYWLWRSWGSGRPRWGELGLVVLAPLVWCLIDALVTGDPLFSLHATSDLADELHRNRSISEVPRDFVSFLTDTARVPVVVAAAVGVVVAWRRRAHERMRAVHVPLGLFLAGSLTFFATSVAGLSVLPRYLTVPAVVLTLPAGYLVTRSRMLLAVAAVGALSFVVIRADAFHRLATELRFIRTTHDDLAAVLRTPQVVAGRGCGPVTLPNYRLVPDTRWILDAGRTSVGSRSARARSSGVALVLVGDKLMRRYGFADGASPETNVPPDGFIREDLRGGFRAYVACR